MYIPLLSRRPHVQAAQIDPPLGHKSGPRELGAAAAVDAYERRAPAGGGGGGGGRSGGASSSSGSKGSSGSSGGAGKSGSGSSKSGAKSVGSGASKQSISGLSGGGSRVSPATSSSGTRGQIFGSSTSRSFGGTRPVTGAPLPLYGFWPVYWISDDTDAAHPSNDTRPGGPLAQAGIELPANQSQIYILNGDRFSLDAILAPIMAATGARNVSLPTDLSQNVTVQEYRDQSFELLRLDGAVTADTNATFLPALNQSIGQNLPIAAAPQLPAVWWRASAVAALAGAALIA